MYFQHHRRDIGNRRDSWWHMHTHALPVPPIWRAVILFVWTGSQHAGEEREGFTGGKLANDAYTHSSSHFHTVSQQSRGRVHCKKGVRSGEPRAPSTVSHTSSICVRMRRIGDRAKKEKEMKVREWLILFCIIWALSISIHLNKLLRWQIGEKIVLFFY